MDATTEVSNRVTSTKGIVEPEQVGWHWFCLYPVHLVAVNGHAKLVGMLLDKVPFCTVDLKAAECEFTALHFAAESSCPDTVQMLLVHGADPKIVCATRSTPLKWAKAENISALLAKWTECIVESVLRLVF